MKTLCWALFLGGGVIQTAHGLKTPRNHVDNDYYVLHLAPTTFPENITTHFGLVHEGSLSSLPDHHVFHRIRGDDDGEDAVQSRLELRKRQLAKRGVARGPDLDVVLDGVLYSERQHARDYLESRAVIPKLEGSETSDRWSENQPLEVISRPVKKPNWKPTYDADISSGSKSWRPRPHIVQPSASASSRSMELKDDGVSTDEAYTHGSKLDSLGKREIEEKEGQGAADEVDVCTEYITGYEDLYDSLDENDKNMMRKCCQEKRDMEEKEKEEDKDGDDDDDEPDKGEAGASEVRAPSRKKGLKLPWEKKKSLWCIPIEFIKLFERPRIRYSSTDQPRDRKYLIKALEITDPSFPEQWHLHTDSDKLHSVEIMEYWLRRRSGKGVTIAIIDDGVEAQNHEWQVDKDPKNGTRFSREGSYNFVEQRDDPTPPGGKNTTYRHGTRSAGVAAAGINGQCGVGVAHGANVSGIRLLGKAEPRLTATEEAEAVAYRTDINDIYTCAWGPKDNGRTVEGPSVLVQRAMHQATKEGRGGKGSVYVFASGNGGRKEDNCNFDGYTNSIYTMTIASAKRNGRHPSYGEECAANLVTAWGSGDDNFIRTVDVGGSCWDTFGGTSSAAPMAAGIIALALEVRPDLTWRDLQHIAVESATNEGLWHSDRQDNRKFSHKFGFGQIKAGTFVSLAEIWTKVGPQSWFYTHLRSPYAMVPIKGSAGDAVRIGRDELHEANFHDRLEHVTLTVTIEAPFRGDLSVDLISPSGTRSKLATPRNADNSTEGFNNWTFMSVANWGERASGEWKVIVKDSGRHREWPDQRTATLVSWELQLFGTVWDIQHVEPLPIPGLKTRKNMNHTELVRGELSKMMVGGR